MILMLKNIQEIKIARIMSKSMMNIDKRLTKHGENVAYTTMRLLNKEPYITKETIANSCLVGLIHDIGAYALPNVNKLFNLSYDTYPDEGCMEGYLALNTLSPLINLSDSVLYQYLDYDKFGLYGAKNPRLSQILNLANSFDICEYNIRALENYRGDKFNPSLLNWLDRLCASKDFRSQLIYGRYQDELDKCLSDLDITSGKLKEYLRTITYPLCLRTKNNMGYSSCVAILASSIARLDRRSEQEISDIYIAGYLHNIGLSKLHGNDFGENSKSHIDLAVSILTGTIPERIISIIKNHHERPDGSGLYKVVRSRFGKLDEILAISIYLVDKLQDDLLKRRVNPTRFEQAAYDSFSTGLTGEYMLGLLVNNSSSLAKSLQDEASDVIIIQNTMEINRLILKKDISKVREQMGNTH